MAQPERNSHSKNRDGKKTKLTSMYLFHLSEKMVMTSEITLPVNSRVHVCAGKCVLTKLLMYHILMMLLKKELQDRACWPMVK